MSKNLTLLLAVSILFSCSQKEEKITDIKQLSDKRICVLTGSSGDNAAREAFPDAVFMDMIAAADAAYSVKVGKAEAFVHNKSVLRSIVKKDSELIILDQPVSKVDIAIAFNKDKIELLSEVNHALNELTDNGTLKIMKEKWIEPGFTVVPGLPDIESSSENGTLKIGTCAKAEPLTFIYNNSITGFDIELGMRIGELLNKKIEFVDMNFEGLVPALKSGKIDFALSNFNVTEERKNFVNFSTPYLDNDIAALVKSN
ncbi:MAG: transporter substrate-binding domain-containing protein [Melioribacteraceae bacterium]|nr:transporter substrate-binding domain-containing protein [Melioribacteraceae bacterium]MCF8356281.1 transporter substrate-binding domain-containing protein [Melioribacteraceae bacterium]MCF8394249.1 transporter substrate-binding domain-containing protein [Melioribacteraceae bacterium]MCF8419970.1 transporter substrate-binding domain-containing protein [Melioribacteraceae bacterium]